MPDHLHLSDRARWICLLLRCVCPPRTCIWGQEVVSQCEHSSTNAVNWFCPTGKHGVIFKLTSLSSTKPHRAWKFQLAFSVLGRHLWFLWESLYFNYKEWKELRRPSYRGWCLNLISPSKQDWKIEDCGGGGVQHEEWCRQGVVKIRTYTENSGRSAWGEHKSSCWWKSSERDLGWTRTTLYPNTRERVWDLFSQSLNLFS